MTEEVKVIAPRDDKGKFKIKEKIIIEEKIVEQLDEVSKEILLGLDIGLKASLGEAIYETYKDYKLPERVKLLQSIVKSVEQFEREKKPIDKTGITEKAGDVPPPELKKEEKKKLPTLAKLNNSTQFLRDMRQHSSYLEKSKKMRKAI